jgi:hypothetical protein
MGVPDFFGSAICNLVRKLINCSRNIYDVVKPVLRQPIELRYA